ncbi:MAG: hypothetical protein DI598_05385 [Pseudopedobacter saltans]|uniref:Uncharacterized protein n=1 Tax=Pseudopedobacter saltans TaxID=151895 RepID=A0A2W5H4M1_9SPHI|nr:MAG: hypothetical protein DI598_05385 [Pseudopedobacter saltans]
MKWSEDLDKFSSGTFSIMQPVKSIDVGDGSIISLFAKVQTTNTKFFLVKGSNLPDISSTLDLDEASIDGIFLNLIKIGANCYIVKYKNYSQNSTSLFLQKINTKTLQLEKEAKDIINYDGQQTANKSRILLGSYLEFTGMQYFDEFIKDRKISYSPDSTKILYKIEQQENKNDPKKTLFIVFDNKLKALYTKEYEWEQPNKKIEINNIMLSDSGNIYICYHLYDKDFNSEFSKTDGDKVPSYTTNVLILDKNSQVIKKISNQGKFLKDVHMMYDVSHHLILYGMYKDIYNGGILGVFRSNTADFQNGEIPNLQFFPFTDELLTAIDKDGFGHEKGNKKGLDYFYNVDHSFFLQNGSLQIVLGYYKMRLPIYPSPTNRADVEKGDIVVANINGNAANFTRIPHDLFTPVGATSLIASVPVFVNGKSILLYIDRDDNLERDSKNSPKAAYYGKNDVGLAAAIFSADGNFLERRMITTSKESDHFVPDLDFTSVGNNNFLFYGRRLKFLKLLVRLGILNIK